MTYLADTLQASIEHLLEGVQIINFDWTYLYVNSAAAKHGRRTVTELVGRTMETCYPGIEQTPLFATLQQVMRTRRPERLVNEFTYPTDEARWFDLRIEPVPDGICVLSLDITEQRALEQKLEQAMKMDAIGRLVGGVAHDFNNLLTAILGYSNFALEAANDASLQADLRQIQSAGERAARLTRRLLTFSRKHVAVPEAVDLRRLIDDLQPMLRRLMPDVQVHVAYSTSQHVPHADPGQLEQIILNLAINARDAMPEGGELHLSVYSVEVSQAIADEHGVSSGSYIVLTVRDTGTGMEPEVLARAFEPFFTTKGPEEGTGLGLPTVRTAVQQNGGFVTLDSQVGVGTTFRVYLPTAAEKTKDVRAPASPGSSHGAETILLVEPDETVRALMLKVLIGCGYHVVHAASTATAVALIQEAQAPIHLIITDLKMPEMHGAHLAQRLIGDHPEARVLYVTGFPDTRAIESGNMSSRVALLLKPFTPAALAERVRRVLDAE